MITVVAALIKKGNKYLIARRSTGDPNVLGKWEFPGGKLQENESEKEAIEREINEEFELIIKAKKFVTNYVCEYPTKVVGLRLYECEYISGDFNLHDRSEYIFVDKADIMNFNLCPADIPLAKFVKENM